MMLSMGSAYRPNRHRIIPALCMVIFFTTTIIAGAETVSSLLNRAIELEGTPYLNGGTDPSGFDCSGFVTYLYQESVPDLPRISRQMANVGELVYPGEWQPGDLLFYATGHDSNRINHVAIWYKEGLLIHSISDGPETGVHVTPAHASYWESRYIAARRVLSSADLSEEISYPDDDLSPDESSPWDSFDGVLRGDYRAWKAAEEEAFEEYKRKNG